MKNLYKVKFTFLKVEHLKYFEIADIEDTCRYETRTNYIMAETPQKAENIVKYNYGKTTTILETTRLDAKEMTR